MDQASLFEQRICSPTLVLFLDCPEDNLLNRLLNRSAISTRFDDNLTIIKKRLQTFKESSIPVISHYEQEGKVFNVGATKSVDEVSKSIQETLKKHLPYNTLKER